MPGRDYSLECADPLFDCRVRRAFSVLTFQECLTLWFSYCGTPAMQDRWLAERLGISNVRVGQLKKQAAEKLERRLKELGVWITEKQSDSPEN
jgi:hypothetical protein